MDKVDADSLILVFRYLSFKERVRLELVCKRWCAVLRLQSTFANVKALNVADFLVKSNRNYYQQDCLSFVPTVIGLVSRCGPYVRTIGFGSRWLKVSQSIIDNISHYCTRLSTLDLGCVILNADISLALTAIGPKLVDFSLEETSWMNQEDGDKVQRQFINMKNLVRINLRRAMFDLSRLTDLPACLEYINISGARGLPTTAFNNFLMFHPNLTELHISPLPCGDQTTLDIIGNMPKLRSLEIGYIQRIEDDTFDLRSLAALTSLEYLHMQNCLPLSTMCFHLMCSNLTNLKSLTVINCQKLYNYMPLGECTQLERLMVGQTIQICDDDLMTVAANHTLRSLNLIKCLNVTTDGIVHLIRNCPINELVITNCEDVGDAALVALATTHLPVHTISMQDCLRISNKGAAALAHLEWLTALKEVDLSYNREIDDHAILAIYEGLREAVEKESLTRAVDEKKMTIYVHRTSVSLEMETLVGDLILLSY